jgi:hypothetical protein
MRNQGCCSLIVEYRLVETGAGQSGTRSFLGLVKALFPTAVSR